MFTGTKTFIRGLLSDPAGGPSSTRVLMFMFSIFSMHLIWRSFYHIYQLKDPTMVAMWLSNMPLLITSLMALISLPYGINKGSESISNIATTLANTKTSNVQTTIGGTIKDLKNLTVEETSQK